VYIALRGVKLLRKGHTYALQVFEITALRRIFGLRRKEMRVQWREVDG
jgi:hypothetical protein